MFGKLGKGASGIEARKLPDMRLHVRAIIRDGSAAFMGSQSLRKLELDGRREVGVIVTDSRIAKKMQAVFEADWAQTPEAKAGEKAEKARRRAAEERRQGSRYFRRVITPESMTCPPRDTALKCISSPLISATRKL